MKKANQIIQEIIQLTTLSKSNYMVLYNSLEKISITFYANKKNYLL